MVGFSPIVRPDGSGQELTDATAEALAQKVEWVRQAAGERFDDLELHVLVAEVVLTDDREHVAQFIATTMASGLGMTAEQVLEVPSVLIGTVEQLCEEVLARREQYGISSVTVFEKHMEAFGSGGGKTCWGVFHLTVPFPSMWFWHHAAAGTCPHRAQLKHVVQDLHA